MHTLYMRLLSNIVCRDSCRTGMRSFDLGMMSDCIAGCICVYTDRYSLLCMIGIEFRIGTSSMEEYNPYMYYWILVDNRFVLGIVNSSGHCIKKFH